MKHSFQETFLLSLGSFPFQLLEIVHIEPEQLNQFDSKLHSNIIKSNYIMARGYIRDRQLNTLRNSNIENISFKLILVIVPLNEITAQINEQPNFKKTLDEIYRKKDDINKLFKRYVQYVKEHAVKINP